MWCGNSENVKVGGAGPRHWRELPNESIPHGTASFFESVSATNVEERRKVDDRLFQSNIQAERKRTEELERDYNERFGTSAALLLSELKWRSPTLRLQNHTRSF